MYVYSTLFGESIAEADVLAWDGAKYQWPQPIIDPRTKQPEYQGQCFQPSYKEPGFAKLIQLKPPKKHWSEGPLASIAEHGFSLEGNSQCPCSTQGSGAGGSINEAPPATSNVYPLNGGGNDDFDGWGRWEEQFLNIGIQGALH